MQTLNIEKFDPTIADLKAIVAETSSITANDLTDKKQLKVVKETRIKLRDARIKITKKGKELREEANTFNKAVLAKEKELLAIVEPEEERLQAIEDEAERLATLEIRKKILPARKEALEAIGDGIECSDEQLLEMNDEQFMEYRIARIDDKAIEDRRKIALEQRKLEEEKAKIARAKELEEAKEQARKEAEQRAEHEAEEKVRQAQQARADAERREKEALERAEREKKEAAERLEKEKVEAEKREKAEKARLEKEKNYKAWIKDNGFDEHTMKLIDSGTEVRMYKLIATYTK